MANHEFLRNWNRQQLVICQVLIKQVLVKLLGPPVHVFDHLESAAIEGDVEDFRPVSVRHRASPSHHKLVLAHRTDAQFSSRQVDEAQRQQGEPRVRPSNCSGNSQRCALFHIK